MKRKLGDNVHLSRRLKERNLPVLSRVCLIITQLLASLARSKMAYLYLCLGGSFSRGPFYGYRQVQPAASGSPAKTTMLLGILNVCFDVLLRC